MCINSLMIDTDIIKCLIDDLLDRICLLNSPAPIQLNSSTYYSSKSIENKFNQSINVLNNSIKQLLKYELNTVVNNGHLTTTSNMRHGRYYNPATTVKQMNDLKKKLHWVQQRQMIVKQYNLNQEKNNYETLYEILNKKKLFTILNVFQYFSPNTNSLENIWFENRLKMLDKSIELLKKQEERGEEEEDEEISDDSSCARCKIYQRKNENDNYLLNKLKRIYQVHNEHNYSKTRVEYSNPGIYFVSLIEEFINFILFLESDLILSLSKMADRIGHVSTSNISNSSKKLISSSIPTKKKQQPKLQSSVSLIVGDTNKNTKRTIEESRNSTNSNFISTNFDLTNKRHKRIGKFSLMKLILNII